MMITRTGGDDLNQLCEAGEDEFLEIMALVGMASKPLHVRRLQKALLEWIMEPGMLLLPVRASISLSSWFIYIFLFCLVQSDIVECKSTDC